MQCNKMWASLRGVLPMNFLRGKFFTQAKEPPEMNSAFIVVYNSCVRALFSVLVPDELSGVRLRQLFVV